MITRQARIRGLLACAKTRAGFHVAGEIQHIALGLAAAAETLEDALGQVGRE